MRYVINLCIVLIFLFGTLPVRAQVPVSTYADKGGDATKMFNLHPFAFNPFEGNITFLKIYKGRNCNKIESCIKLKQTTTLVVIDNEESEYGKALKKAFANNWTYTPYKIIKPSEVCSYARRQGFSFFMFMRDEYKEGTGIGPNGTITYIHGTPNLYYLSDSMQHGPRFFGTQYSATYMFVLALRCGSFPQDTTETDITDAFSYADYTLPGIDNDFSCTNAGSKTAKEKETITQLNTIVLNIDRDMQYMNKNKREKTATFQTLKYTMQSKGGPLQFKLNVGTFEGGQDSWVNKSLYINSKLSNEFGRTAIAGLLGLDNGKVKLATENEIENAKKTSGNNIMIWDTCMDEYDDYQVIAPDGTELIRIGIADVNEIFNKKRANKTGDYQTTKCAILYNSKEYAFKFHYVTFGETCKKIVKNKTLYINSESVDEFGKGLTARILGMDTQQVKLVPPYQIDSLIHKGDNNALIFSGNSMDESRNYMITTIDGIELIGMQSAGFNKDVGELDLIGADKWSERKKMSLK